MVIEPYHEHFGQEMVEDGEWLQYVAAKGWSALTHNKYIRYERDQLDDLMSFGVKTFFIIGRGPQNTEFAPAILAAYPRLRKLIRKEPKPFAGKIFQDRRRAEVWVRYDEWQAGRTAHVARKAPYASKGRR
jgi:PIN domain-containing protein